MTFFPIKGRPIFVSVSEDGEYEVDLLPGEYALIVNVGVELPPGFKEGDPIPPSKIDLPAEYTTRAKSTLKATVEPNQSEPIDFVLE